MPQCFLALIKQQFIAKIKITSNNRSLNQTVLCYLLVSEAFPISQGHYVEIYIHLRLLMSTYDVTNISFCLLKDSIIDHFFRSSMSDKSSTFMIFRPEQHSYLPITTTRRYSSYHFTYQWFTKAFSNILLTIINGSQRPSPMSFLLLIPGYPLMPACANTFHSPHTRPYI